MAIVSDGICFPSDGLAKVPGGNLKWHCSREFHPSSETEKEFLQKLPIFQEFLEKQDEAMSLFMEGLLHNLHKDNLPKTFNQEHCSIISHGEHDEDREIGRSTMQEAEHCLGEAPDSPSRGNLSVNEFKAHTHMKKQGFHFHRTLHSTGLGPLENLFVTLEVWSEWYVNLKEPQRNSFIAKFINSMPFAALTVAVILLNTVCIAIDANYKMENLGESSPHWLEVAESVFVIFYIIEILLKFVVHGMYFFAREEILWNAFDILVILGSVFTMFLAGDSSDTNMGFLRTIRILRATKALRMFRIITFLRDLRIMLACILGSFLALFWCLVLLTLIGTVFAIFYVQALAGSLKESDLTVDEQRGIVDMFGSVARALLTLYKMTTGMIDGEVVFRVLEPTGFLNPAVLLGLIGFYQISVINILSGIFVEKAMHHAKPEREEEVIERRKGMMERVNALKELVGKIQLSNDGYITRDEFMLALHEPTVRYHFEAEDLDVRDAEAFFELLQSVNGNSAIDIDTFVASCMRMRGAATSVDLQTLQLQLKKSVGDVQIQMKSMMENSLHQFRKISRSIKTAEDRTKPPKDEGESKSRSAFNENNARAGAETLLPIVILEHEDSSLRALV